MKENEIITSIVESIQEMVSQSSSTHSSQLQKIHDRMDSIDKDDCSNHYLKALEECFKGFSEKLIVLTKNDPSLFLLTLKIMQLAIRLDLLRATALDSVIKSICSLISETQIAQAPEILLAANAFMRNARWLVVDEDENFHITQRCIDKQALQAAQKKLKEVNSLNEVLIAHCLHIALTSDSKLDTDALTDACRSFIAYASQSKNGFTLRLGFEIVLTALEKLLPITGNDRAIITRLIHQMDNMTPDGLEKGVTKEYYQGLSQQLQSTL